MSKSLMHRCTTINRKNPRRNETTSLSQMLLVQIEHRCTAGVISDIVFFIKTLLIACRLFAVFKTATMLGGAGGGTGGEGI